MQKTVRKNTKYSRNETILKIGHHPKPIAHESLTLGQKLKLKKKKQVKIYSANHLDLFCAKIRGFQPTRFELTTDQFALQLYGARKFIN